jgi:Trk K+ transport system NAD-binding subunit
MGFWSGRPEGRVVIAVGIVGMAVGVGIMVLSSVALGVPVFSVALVISAFAPFADRTKKAKVGATGFEVDLSDHPHGAGFVQAAAHASDRALEAMIPLLAEDVDVATAVVVVPAAYAGATLTDARLQWIRRELNIAVFAAKRPDDPTWRGGGRISTLRLVAGTELAVAGDRADIQELERRLERGE